MGVEVLPVRGDDGLVGVAAIEREALGHAVADAPEAVGFVVVAPEAPVVPDAPRVERRTAALVDRDAEDGSPGDDFPGRAGEVLTVSEAAEAVPNGVGNG